MANQIKCEACPIADCCPASKLSKAERQTGNCPLWVLSMAGQDPVTKEPLTTAEIKPKQWRKHTRRGE